MDLEVEVLERQRAVVVALGQATQLERGWVVTEHPIETSDGVDGSSPGMLKVFAFLTKREGLETRAFIDYYANHQVPLVRSSPAALRRVNKRNYVVRGDESGNREGPAIDFAG